MTASKTRMPHYTKDGVDYYASQITDIQPYTKVANINAPDIIGSQILYLDNGKQSPMLGKWIRENNPEIGGYMVVWDTPKGNACEYKSKNEFESNFVKE